MSNYSIGDLLESQGSSTDSDSDDSDNDDSDSDDSSETESEFDGRPAQKKQKTIPSRVGKVRVHLLARMNKQI